MKTTRTIIKSALSAWKFYKECILDKGADNGNEKIFVDGYKLGHRDARRELESWFNPDVKLPMDGELVLLKLEDFCYAIAYWMADKQVFVDNEETYSPKQIAMWQPVRD